MSDARSLIERMIDKACGIPNGPPDPINGRDADRAWLVLLCPACGWFMASESLPEDPRGATLMEVCCPNCNDGDFDAPVYFDGAGCELSQLAAQPRKRASKGARK